MTNHTHSHNVDFKKTFTVTKEEKSQVKISGDIPYEELLNERGAAIKKLGRTVKIDGFRAGHIPEAVLVKHIGEMAVLMEMAERAIAHFYPHIIEAHKLDTIGYPQVEITKIAPNNPLGFTAVVTVIPEITLPDYQKIAKDINKAQESETVTDEEVETKIKDVLRQKAAYERLQKKANPDEKPIENIDELEIPELTDEVAKTLGDFKDVSDFKAKLREHLEIEKKQEVKTNHRVKLTDAIIDATTIDTPQILIDSEINQMFAQMEEDLKRSNLTMEAYLAHIKKTKEEIIKEWTPSAERRAKLQLILNKLAQTEKIKADEKLVEKQVKEIKTMYKDAQIDRVYTYVYTLLTNEAVLVHLEEIK